VTQGGEKEKETDVSGEVNVSLLYRGAPGCETCIRRVAKDRGSLNRIDERRRVHTVDGGRYGKIIFSRDRLEGEIIKNVYQAGLASWPDSSGKKYRFPKAERHRGGPRLFLSNIKLEGKIVVGVEI